MNTISITPTSAEQEAKILHFLHELGIKPRVRKTAKIKTHYTLEEIIGEDGFDLEELQKEVKALIDSGWDGSE
jgi:predicted Ser/Thr protein kinase